MCTGKKACGICLKPPFPEGAFYVVEGADDKVRVNWDLASDVDEELVSLCPTHALDMYGKRMTVDEVLDEVREGRFHLPQFRRRHDPQRRRVPASTRLRRSTA